MMSWKTFRQQVPRPQSRVLIWLPRQKSWELALLTDQQFTLLSGKNCGTTLPWREVSHFLEIEAPMPKEQSR